VTERPIQPPPPPFGCGAGLGRARLTSSMRIWRSASVCASEQVSTGILEPTRYSRTQVVVAFASAGLVSGLVAQAARRQRGKKATRTRIPRITGIPFRSSKPIRHGGELGDEVVSEGCCVLRSFPVRCEVWSSSVTKRRRTDNSSISSRRIRARPIANRPTAAAPTAAAPTAIAPRANPPIASAPTASPRRA